MPRPFRTITVAVVSLLVAGCQDYNFNPVGQCVIQPGAERISISDVSTVDVLFVVDDSGSMGGEQAELAANFDRFIGNLDAANRARVSGGLVPIDFHIAVTTSSVYWNFETTQTCRSDCAGADGQLVCCVGQTPVRQARKCTSDAQCVPGTACRLDCARLQGEHHCCAADGSVPAGALTELVSCEREGAMCGTLETHYDFRGCSNGISPNQWPYPQGDFVSFSSAPGFVAPNPRVLHFDKELYGPAGVNRQGYSRAQLVEWFRQNIRVGTCGSGQEQALQAGRLAVEKAFAGQQRDTRDGAGAVAWTAPTATQVNGPSASARWPNANSKLVVVFVGDEDDCSAPRDPSGGVVMLSESPGSDACTRDATAPAPVGGKQFAVSDFVGFFTSLGRPVAAGFIFPAAQSSCSLGTCTATGLCCHPTLGCDAVNGAQARGTRLLATAEGLSRVGVEVVAGSICDPDFGKLLNDIAEIVKPPETLTLPSEPAESRIALLRILRPNGDTRKLCGAPLAPGPGDLATAQATGADWWFTVGVEPGAPVAVSRFVYINPRGSCVANPGETYSADYLGVVPAGGCTSDQECTDKLGGQAGAFQCFMPPGLSRGTCTCRGTQ